MSKDRYKGKKTLARFTSQGFYFSLKFTTIALSVKNQFNLYHWSNIPFSGA
ncbi:hypothetical protein SAMN04487931_12229 [Desulfobacula phenolica]|uniref:Uncharacterized protein n=1 Tax=Desulfobacula phenolica TaxID=90732 RepID=A0A1H2K776_9BACT|nr:hypothetical protein SAMN04487931_12229 [Desulfobacula phenolica]